MNFKRNTGSANTISLPKNASTALEIGDVVTISSGKAVKADALATPATIKGIAGQTIMATDLATSVSIDVPNESTDVFIAKIGAGTFGTTKVGQRYDLDGDGAVDLTSQTTNVVEVVGEGAEAGTVKVRFVLA